MRFLLPLTLAALAAAAPAPEPSRILGRALSTAQTLAHDDVIMYGINGEYKIIKDHEFDHLTSTGVLKYGGGEELHTRDTAPAISARDCPGRSNEFTVTSTQDFLDWDVQMSAVIGAQQAVASISVAHGYQISNSVEVTRGLEAEVEGIGASLQISVTQTWSTIDTTTITYVVPLGQNGVIVSQPWTHRVYGDIYTTCDESNWSKSGGFMASKHTSESYGNMNWVTGVIRLCANQAYPIPYCNGQGYHH
ncbi:hypothetical protein CCHL11_07888 [Colletotrichum chlorophyti]|uniref:Uncharacterized protein n=1 Tax=Colletotrichum chlorophyti TaxID=708187 RepID=A0A1Q8RR67_9PEZI|nr:hypothetical protein CCHL11_07888 [Colletotrichum chlorophyti]